MERDNTGNISLKNFTQRSKASSSISNSQMEKCISKKKELVYILRFFNFLSPGFQLGCILQFVAVRSTEQHTVKSNIKVD